MQYTLGALALLAATGSPSTWAQAVPAPAASAAPPAASVDHAQERRRIAAEKRQAEQRFDAARRECETRFAVSGCVEEARGERQRALARLADQQAVLDDAQRRQRAAERMRSIDEKSRQAREGAATPAASAVVRGNRAAPAARPPAPAAAESRLQVTPQEAAQRRDQRSQREQEAATHRDAVLRRNAERDARKPPSAPLPVPGAASVPASSASRGSP